MQNIGLVGDFGFVVIFSTILKVMCYIAFIMVAVKAHQALNVYINKNS